MAGAVHELFCGGCCTFASRVHTSYYVEGERLVHSLLLPMLDSHGRASGAQGQQGADKEEQEEDNREREEGDRVLMSRSPRLASKVDSSPRASCCRVADGVAVVDCSCDAVAKKTCGREERRGRLAQVRNLQLYSKPLMDVTRVPTSCCSRSSPFVAVCVQHASSCCLINSPCMTRRSVKACQ